MALRHKQSLISCRHRLLFTTSRHEQEAWLQVFPLHAFLCDECLLHGAFLSFYGKCKHKLTNSCDHRESTGMLRYLTHISNSLRPSHTYMYICVKINYRQTYNISRIISQNIMFLVSSCSCRCTIYSSSTTSEWSTILLPIKVMLI